MGYISRFLICFPIVNIFYYCLFPKTAYRELFYMMIENKGVSVDDFWNTLTKKEQELLEEFDIKPERTMSEPPTQKSDG